MPKVTYTCTFSATEYFSSHPSASLSGPSSLLPDGAVVTDVELRVRCGISKYKYTADTNFTLTDSSGASEDFKDTTYTGEETPVWLEFGDKPDSQLNWNNLTTISMFGTDKVTVREGNTATLTLEYIVYTNCTSPTEITVDPTSAAPGGSATLSWKGASGGENNPITSFSIYRATEANGIYNLLKELSPSYDNWTVTAPTTNGASYYYKVRAYGTPPYDGELSTAFATLTCSYSSVGAPTTVTVSPTNAAPGGEATLSWSGATPGTNNAIRGYEVYRATSADGEYTSIGTTKAAETSMPVYASETNGESYYYKVVTLGTTANTDSGKSAVYAALSCTYSAPTPPTSVTVDGSSSVYALPDTEVRLKWDGASEGANNPITGYKVYVDGTLYSEEDTNTASINVPTHGVGAHRWTVVTLGTHSDGTASDAAVVYTYTNPTAPTEVTVSETNPAAGSRVVLSWKGAAGGGLNAITGYGVYRATEVNGEYKLIYSTSANADSGSCPVDAPSTAGSSYYYRVETMGEVSTSGQSSVYASVTAVEAPSIEDSDITVIVKPPKRKKRGLVLDDYDTATEGWTLCELALAEPETQTSFVEVLGRSLGPIDMSTALTNGDPRYLSRELSARLECSEGTRDERNDAISVMTNKLHGQRVDIVLPDDPTRYITGRVSVTTEYSDMAHASVALSAVCDPWRYNKTETVVEVMALDDETSIMLSNEGRRVISPEVTVSGYGANVRLACGADTWSLNEGTYHLSGLALKHGNTLLTCYGYGTLTFRYREAIL